MKKGIRKDKLTKTDALDAAEAARIKKSFNAIYFPLASQEEVIASIVSEIRVLLASETLKAAADANIKYNKAVECTAIARAEYLEASKAADEADAACKDAYKANPNITTRGMCTDKFKAVIKAVEAVEAAEAAGIKAGIAAGDAYRRTANAFKDVVEAYETIAKVRAKAAKANKVARANKTVKKTRMVRDGKRSG